jgi:hypothetical protein
MLRTDPSIATFCHPTARDALSFAVGVATDRIAPDDTGVEVTGCWGSEGTANWAQPASSAARTTRGTAVARSGTGTGICTTTSCISGRRDTRRTTRSVPCW